MNASTGTTTQTDPHTEYAHELAVSDLPPADLLDHLEEVGYANGSRVVVVIARQLRNILTDSDDDALPQRPIGAEKAGAAEISEQMSPARREYQALRTRLVCVQVAVDDAPEPTGPGDDYHERMRLQSALDEIRRTTDQLGDLLPAF